MGLKIKMKIATNICMTVALQLLMAYELIGSTAHEWIGMTMFLLLVFHHVLNIQWTKSLFKGKYKAFRFAQTALVIMILITMCGSMMSGIILSRHIFTFLPIHGGQTFARTLHILSAYWGFVLMPLHVGLHWGMMVEMVKRLAPKTSRARAWTLRGIAVLIAGYGAYAFIDREIGSYMLLKNTFVFFDFEEPLFFFFIDYLAMMGLFVFISYYLSTALKKWNTGKVKS